MEKKKKSHHILPMLIAIFILVVGGYFACLYMRANTFCKAVEKDEFVVWLEADSTKKVPSWLTKLVEFINDGEEVKLSHYRIEGGYSNGVLEGNLMVGTQRIELTDFILQENLSLVDIGGVFNNVRKLMVGDNALLNKIVPEWTIVPYVPFNTMGKVIGNEDLKNSELVGQIESLKGEIKPIAVMGLLLSADEKTFLGSKYTYHITGEDKRIATLEQLSGRDFDIAPDTDVTMEIEFLKGGVVSVDITCNKLSAGQYENVILHLELTEYTLQKKDPEYVKEEDADQFLKLFEVIKNFFL